MMNISGCSSNDLEENGEKKNRKSNYLESTNSMSSYEKRSILEGCTLSRSGTKFFSYLYTIKYLKSFFFGTSIVRKKRFVLYDMEKKILRIFKYIRSKKPELEIELRNKECEIFLLQEKRRFTLSVEGENSHTILMFEADSKIMFDRWTSFFMRNNRFLDQRVTQKNHFQEKIEQVYNEMRITLCNDENEEEEGENENEDFRIVKYEDFESHSRPWVKEFILTSPYHAFLRKDYPMLTLEKKHVMTWNQEDVLTWLKFIKVRTHITHGERKTFFDFYGDHFKEVDGRKLILLFGGGDYENKKDRFTNERNEILNGISRCKFHRKLFFRYFEDLEKECFFNIYEYIILSKIEKKLESRSFRIYFQKNYDKRNREHENIYYPTMSKILHYSKRYRPLKIGKDLERIFANYLPPEVLNPLDKEGEIRIPVSINLNHDLGEDSNNLRVMNPKRIGSIIRSKFAKSKLLKQSDLPFYVTHSSLQFGPLLLHWGLGEFMIYTKITSGKKIPESIFFSGHVGYVTFKDELEFRNFVQNELLFEILKWNRDFGYQQARNMTQKKVHKGKITEDKETKKERKRKKKNGISGIDFNFDIGMDCDDISDNDVFGNGFFRKKKENVTVPPGVFLSNCQQAVVYFITKVFKIKGFKSDLSSLSEEIGIWKDETLGYGTNEMCFDFSRIKNFKEIFELQNISGQKIVFENHDQLDRFFMYLLSRNGAFIMQFSGAYQLLQSFDRAFWLRHYRNRKEVSNLPYKLGCPFNYVNFRKTMKFVNENKWKKWGRRVKKQFGQFGKGF